MLSSKHTPQNYKDFGSEVEDRQTDSQSYTRQRTSKESHIPHKQDAKNRVSKSKYAKDKLNIDLGEWKQMLNKKGILVEQTTSRSYNHYNDDNDQQQDDEHEEFHAIESSRSQNFRDELSQISQMHSQKLL